MLNSAFWQTTRVLWNYKRQLAVAALGALVSAACFGAGLGMVLPTLYLLLNQRKTLQELIAQYIDKPAVPLFVRGLANAAAPYIPANPFWAFVLVMGVITVLAIVGSTGRYLHEWITLTITSRVTMIWRARLFRRMVHLPLIQLQQTGTSDHLTRLIADTRLLNMGHQAILGRAVAESLKGAFALATAMILDWRLTLIALVGAPAIGIVLRKFGKRIRRASRATLQQYTRLIAAIKEALGGAQVVKVHLAEGYERRRFNRLNRAVFDEEMRMRQAKALAGPLVETLALIGVMLVAIVAAYYIFYYNRTPASFITVLAALVAAANSMKSVTGLNSTLHEAAAAAQRLIEVVNLPVEPTGVHTPPSARWLERHRGAIAFDQVTFSYPTQKAPAVRAVSLHARFGQTIAIVGGNGSGKTTLLSMLPRLIEPGAGCVRIDDVDVASASLRSLRKQIAVVTQQTILFEGTIAENICYGRRHESRERIVAAAQAAFADEFIAGLPQGYDTRLGEGGSGLSGGQRQRLCIARAILRDPAILILDEATSQIDADSEAKITRALAEFRHGRTTFVIAHRLSTVVDADLIVVMDQGAIVDQGKHAALLARCAIYQQLVQTQLLPGMEGM